MPLSTSPCRGRCDANVATEAGQGAAGAKPACAVRGPDVLNSCELAEGGPFVLAFVFEPVARCRDAAPGARAGRGAPPRRRRSGSSRCAPTPRRRALAALDAAGRLRQRRGGRERVRGRRLPDDHVRAARREGRRVERRPARRGRARGLGGADCGAEPPIVVAAADRALPEVGSSGAASTSSATRCGARRPRCAGGCTRCRTATAARERSRRPRARSREAYRRLFRGWGGERRSPAEELTHQAADPRPVPLARRAP